MVLNRNTHKNIGTFPFKMQVKKNIMKCVILCNIPRNMQEMPKYVKVCRIKFNCSNANAAIRGDYYFLSIYVVRNEIYIYIEILAPLIAQVQIVC
jgi:hypothetical protein